MIKHPSTVLVNDPSQSGKTIFLWRLIEECQTFISPPVEKIIFCYGEDQLLYQKIRSPIPIEFIAGFNEEIYQSIDGRQRVLLILDDLVLSSLLGKDKATINTITSIFIRGSHHKN